jgi:hypothetical protein
MVINYLLQVANDIGCIVKNNLVVKMGFKARSPFIISNGAIENRV